MDVIDDAQLLSRSRAGDAGAYAQLYERHVGTALHVARQLTDEAEDVVSDAFMRTYAVLREGRGPDVAFRPYLLRAVRNAAIDRHRRVGRITPRDSLEDAATPLHQQQSSVDPVIDQLEQQLVARAFRTLPERWQMVLWHTEVQGESPAQVAPLLGISPRAVAQLAVRAREGLRTAWLQEHVLSAPPGHEEMVRLLAAHTRGSLGLRDRRALEAHLTECPDCRRLRNELADVNSRLGVILVPALLGLSMAKLAWHAEPATAAVAPAASAAAAGTVEQGAAGPGSAAAGGAEGSITTETGAGAGVAAGGTAGAPTTAGSLTTVTKLLGTTMAAMSQPVTAGLLAATVATTGIGVYVAHQSGPARPAAPGDSPPAQVTPAPTGPGPASPSSEPPAPSGPGGSGSPDSGTPTESGSPGRSTSPGSSGASGSGGTTPTPSTTSTGPATSGSPSTGPSTPASSSPGSGTTSSSGPAAGTSAPGREEPTASSTTAGSSSPSPPSSSPIPSPTTRPGGGTPLP